MKVCGYQYGSNNKFMKSAVYINMATAITLVQKY